MKKTCGKRAGQAAVRGSSTRAAADGNCVGSESMTCETKKWVIMGLEEVQAWEMLHESNLHYLSLCVL